MVRSILLKCCKNIIRSVQVPPSRSGNISIVQSLCILGTITASCSVMGYTKRWIHIDPILWQWIQSLLCISNNYTTPNTSLTNQSTGSTRDSMMFDKTNDLGTNNKSANTILSEFSRVFVRVLFVPSFCEEIIWRCCVLLPHLPQPISIYYIFGMNLCYTLSHVIHANVLAAVLHRQRSNPIRTNTSNRSSNEEGDDDTKNKASLKAKKDLTKTTYQQKDAIESTIEVFTDPSFLFVTLVLGNVCSYSYIQAGYAIYAPVLIHTVSVSIWLTFLGGNQALGRT